MMRVVVLLGAIALTSTACTLLWLFNEDPENLPCDTSTDKHGQCLKGYVCVSADRGQDTTPELLCVKAGFKKAGDGCAKTEECSGGLVCATSYNDCAVPEPDDINCNLVSEGDKGLACRTTCDPANTTATCAIDQRCFEETGENFCENGTCNSDSDCNPDVSAPPALCSGVERQGGKTGLCFLQCDPTKCDSQTCPDCTTLSGAVEEGKQCLPVADEGVPLSALRFICDDTGPTPAFGNCGDGSLCQFGSFCNLTDQGPLCTPWCDLRAPACDNPHQCQQIATNSFAGFCL